MRANVSGGGDFELPPEGYQKARCVRAIDLGTQESQWKGNISYKPQLQLVFELPEHLVEFEGESRPMLISKKYNLTFSKKATLRKDMESWYDKQFNDKDIEAAGGFDPSKVVGRPAKIRVVHNHNENSGNTYANVDIIIPDDSVPDQIHESIVIDLDDLNMDHWNKLSEKMQAWIMKSPEAQKLFETTGSSEPAPQQSTIGDDDIPF